MANLLTKVSKKAEPATLHEPFRSLSDLLRWDPYRESGVWAEAMEFSPSFEVKETDNAYVFKADVPGIHEENLDIQLAGNRLTISGKRETEKKEEKETWHLTERRFGSFTRTFTLPEE
ncbi:MAG TPA: Hsp20/alpha crystallin family protein, partial [Holophagaceae bacterium]|nr:Hsp20/alpha crystallin family protein [Holophagaceae bacterium]